MKKLLFLFIIICSTKVFAQTYPAGLNVNDNQYQLIFAQRPLSGSKADIAGFVPVVPDFTLESKVTCFGKRDDANIFSVPFSKSGFVNGSIPTGDSVFSIYGAVPDPAFLMAWHLDKICQERGIIISEGATTRARGVDPRPGR